MGRGRSKFAELEHLDCMAIPDIDLCDRNLQAAQRPAASGLAREVGAERRASAMPRAYGKCPAYALPQLLG